MPIYEYRCASCAHQLDAIRKIAEAPLTDCPACGQPTLRRLVSAPSFRLKGEGWYETDFKNKKDKRRNLAGDDAGGGSASASAGVDAAPADKTDSASSADASHDSTSTEAGT